MTNMREWVIAAAILMVFLLPGNIAAHEEGGSISRPLANEGPIRVYVTMGLLDVDEIDGANQSFTVNFFTEARWMDPTLAHSGPGRRIYPLREVWSPQLLFVNQQKIWPTFPAVAQVAPNGEVLLRQRVWGPFSQPLDVQDFPFDTQEFEIRVACADAATNEVLFLPDPKTSSGLAEQFSLPDWEIIDWELRFDAYRPRGSSRGVASCAFAFHAARYSSHYVWKVILPLILIVAMSWIVFWIDPRESGTQIGVATTSMLTLIAYRFMVGTAMPTVPYLTRMDYFILGSTLLVFAALMQAVITSIMANRDRLRLARWFDRCSRLVFPGIFAAIVHLSLFA